MSQHELIVENIDWCLRFSSQFGCAGIVWANRFQRRIGQHTDKRFEIIAEYEEKVGNLGLKRL